MKFSKLIQLENLQKGQALLIIVLIMVVILTIGLSLATRSLVNTRSSTEENNSQEAFTAAEAGIEQLLQSQSGTPISGGFGNVTYSAQVVNGSQSEFLLNGGNQVLRGEGVDLWLSTYPTYTGQWTGQFTLYWGSNSDDCSVAVQDVAAIEVVLLSGADKNNPSAQHYVFDPCPVRRNANNFDGTVGTTTRQIEGRTFAWMGTVSVTNPGFIARIIPLYANTFMGVVGSPALPSQGKTVESTGQASGTARKISVFQSYPRLPIEIFPYVIFSP